MQLRAVIVAAGVCMLARSAAAENGSVVLPIAARAQADEAPSAGWCGETAIQEALLHYGAYVPQRDINRAGKPSHPDLYWSDLPTAMRALGLRFRAWSGRGGLDAFLTWSTAQFEAGRPVLAGVKLYPTAHPAWGLDHIVLLTGIDASGVRINTTWGHALRRSRAELDSTRRGMSLRNRSRRQHAYVIEGLGTSAHSARLRIDDESGEVVKATLVLDSLVAKQRYRVVRSARAGGAATWRHDFVADAESVAIPVRFERGRASFFRAAAVSVE